MCVCTCVVAVVVVGAVVTVIVIAVMMVRYKSIPQGIILVIAHSSVPMQGTRTVALLESIPRNVLCLCPSLSPIQVSSQSCLGPLSPWILIKDVTTTPCARHMPHLLLPMLKRGDEEKGPVEMVLPFTALPQMSPESSAHRKWFLQVHLT